MRIEHFFCQLLHQVDEGRQSAHFAVLLLNVDGVLAGESCPGFGTRALGARGVQESVYSPVQGRIQLWVGIGGVVDAQTPPPVRVDTAPAAGQLHQGGMHALGLKDKQVFGAERIQPPCQQLSHVPLAD